MTATHEEDNRRWIRMSRYPLVDSLRHVASVFLFLSIIVTLLNGESILFLFSFFLSSYVFWLFEQFEFPSSKT